MKISSTILTLSMAAAFTTPAAEPTASELLERGVYLEQTRGDLPGAIELYEQIIESHR